MIKKLLQLSLLICFGVMGLQQAYGQIIISQYYEGTSNNKWVEITNVSESSVDLTSPQLYLALFSNASADNPGSNSPTNTETLSGNIAAGASILFKNSSAVIPTYASGSNSATCNFNGDDLLVITSSVGSTAWADRTDVVGNGSSWGENTSFYRNNTITSGNTTFLLSEWTEVSNSAVDDASVGTSERLGEHLFSSGVNLAPNITNITNTPLVPSSSQTVTISADITDTDGIASAVNLNWGTSSGSLTNTVSMTNTAGDTYEGTIPTQSNGTTVFFEIEATDNNASPESTTSAEQSYTVIDPFTLPFTEDFSTGLYTVTLGGEGSDGTQDYFFITDGTNINKTYTGATGNFFAGQDIDDGGWAGSASPSQLTWEDIDISGITNLDFSCDFASVGGGIDAADFLLFEYRVDGGSWNNIIAFENTDGTNTNFGEDTNFDGSGDGTQLTSVFATFIKSFTVSGSSLDMRFTAAINSANEEFAIDNLVLAEGCLAPTNQATAFNATGIDVDEATLNWTRGIPSGGDNVLVLVKEANAIDTDPANGTAYTANTVFGNGDEIGTGNFAVFNGSAADVTVTGLNSNTTYHVAVYEYNNLDNCYLIPGLTGSFTTLEPSISLTGGPISGLNYFFGDGPSSAQSFQISGTNLDGTDVLLNAPANFEISETQTGTYSSSITLNTYDGTSQNIWVRLQQGLSVDTYNGDITITGGGDPAPPTLALNGNVGTNNDSEIDGPVLASQPDPVLISSTVDTDAEAVRVFDFDVYDFGSGDNLPTIITQVTIQEGSNNDVDWSANIENVKLSIDGGTTFASIGTATINAGSIIIPVTSGLSIDDGDIQTVSLFIYLKNSGLTDNGTLEFTIPTTGNGFEADTNGSTFASTFSNPTTSNQMLIDVEATSLAFTQQPINTPVNLTMTPSPIVEAVDDNGNLDVDFTGSVALNVSAGTTSFDLSATTNLSAVAGVATFSNLIFDIVATGNELTASATGLTDEISNSFDVAAAPVFPAAGDLIITEVSDASDFNNEFIEIYNTTSSLIDMSTSKLVMQNDGTVWDFDDDIPNAVIPPNGFLIVTRGGTQTVFETEFGILNAQSVFVEGTGGMFFGATPRRWQLYEGGTVSTADGALIDDTVNTVAGSGNRDFFDFLTDAYVSTSDDLANPGAIDNLVYESATWKYNAKADATTGESDVYFMDSFTATEELAMNDGEVSANRVLDLNGNSLSINGTFTFKSDATGTAQLDDATSSTISGNVTTERYIPAKRAFRFLSSAVGGQSIADSWQQAIHITGAQGTVGNTSPEGFDETASGAPSMFTFNTGSQNWSPIPNTNATNLDAGTAYRVLVRGDRASVDLTSNNSPISAVTLSATGTLATGSLTTGTDLPALASGEEDFSFLGNPYQAIVDASELTYSGGVRSDYIVYWDPNLGDRGAFVQIELSSGDQILPDPAPTPSSTEASQFIMPGQAFFVGNDVSVTSPSITFDEADKATAENQTAVFSTTNLAYLNLRLYTADAYNNHQPEQDALGIRWSEAYTTDASNEDIAQLTNPDENFAVINSGSILGIDKRNFPTDTESIPLFVNGYTTDEYLIYNQFANLPENAKLYIEDHYLETTTELENGEVYTFNVDTGVPASMSNTRFSLQFEVGTLSNINFEANTMKIYPNPVEDELSIHWKEALSLDTQISIYSSIGKKVAEFSLKTNKEEQSIPVDMLEAGIYLLQIQDEQTKVTKKFIKM